MQSEQTLSPLARLWYPLTIRLRIMRRNLFNFLAELLRHPTAVLGAVVIMAYVLAAIFAPHLTAHDPTRGDLNVRLLPPAWQQQRTQGGGEPSFLLGTDAQGRDLLARIIYGARISLWVGILAVGISVLIGATLGCITGYFRGWIDQAVSRFADLLLAFPFLIFAIGVMAFLGPGFVNLIAALCFKGWVGFFRLVRGEMLSEKTKEYVEAAKVMGLSSFAIIVSEIIPNIFHSVLVLGTLRMGFFIIMEASLSFLGLGIQPPTPAWGSMVADGRNHLMTSWWVSTLPGMAILILVLSINLFGEGLRDILDPRLRIE
ncbi:MAG: ABC transporter permease subunit [Anaerolineae bacterium]|nr:ABC transporter permease subunit [Anaerolineae bacterium]